jgi:hypothetical protein
MRPEGLFFLPWGVSLGFFFSILVVKTAREPVSLIARKMAFSRALGMVCEKKRRRHKTSPFFNIEIIECRGD